MAPNAALQIGSWLSPISATAAGKTPEDCAAVSTARVAVIAASRPELMTCATARASRLGGGFVSVEQFAQPRLDVFADRVADDVVGLAQFGRGACVGQSRLLHDDRDLDVPPRLAQQLVRVVQREAGDGIDDAARAIAMLLR